MSTKLFILVAALTALFLGNAQAQSGSLWPGKARVVHSIYADPVAASVGDLVTIIVNINTVSTKEQQTSTAKNASVNDTITALGYPQNDGVFDWYRYRDLAPSAAWNAAQSFDGGGSINNRETLTTTIQARVTEVLPNGNMLVEARRQYETGKEKSTLILTGIVRREDLDGSNQVSSANVANLRIVQEGAGPLSRSQRKGWLTTLYEFISPF